MASVVGQTEKGRRISAAKTGVRQVKLADDELLLTEAVKDGIATYVELREGVTVGPDGPNGDPWLRHRTEPVPGGRLATIFGRTELVEDLAEWREKTGSKKARGSRALRAKEREKMRALGAIPLAEAVAAVGQGVDTYTVQEWVRRRHPASVIRGPRGDYWARSQQEFESDLEPFRCSREGCSAFALLSTSGRCRVDDPYVDRGGRLTATEFAEKHQIDDPSLLARLEAGEVPAEREDRRGRPGGWLIDEDEALPVMRDQFLCERDGCERFALGPTRHCSRHAAGAFEVVKKAIRGRHGLASLRRVMGRMAKGRAAERGKPVGRPKGSFNLAEEEVQKIRELRAAGKTQQQIALSIGVSRDQVRSVIAR